MQWLWGGGGAGGGEGFGVDERGLIPNIVRWRVAPALPFETISTAAQRGNRAARTSKHPHAPRAQQRARKRRFGARDVASCRQTQPAS